MRPVYVTWWRPAEDEAARRAAFLPWLSPGELARHGRFIDASHRDAFLASRILLRHALAAVTGEPAADLTFSTDEHGIKPYLTTRPAGLMWHFSLTHTDGFVACAVTLEGDVGIDAEPVARDTRIAALARRVLSSDEQVQFDGFDGDRRRRFFEYWCVKEAWLKAEGTGLRVPPASVEVTFAADDVRVNPATRQVRLLPIDPAYVVAVVYPSSGPEDGAIIVRPLDWPALQL